MKTEHAARANMLRIPYWTVLQAKHNFTSTAPIPINEKPHNFR
jgi:hypothetical protein